jgi:hypothetical protein
MFRKHLDTSKTTYLEHLTWSVIAGFRLIYAGISSIIHGVVPTLFDGTAPKQIIDIYHNHLEDHPNERYQEMISKAKKETH